MTSRVILTDRHNVAGYLHPIVVVFSLLLVLQTNYSKVRPHILFYLPTLAMLWIQGT